MGSSSMSGQGAGGVRYGVGWAGQYLNGVSRSEGNRDAFDADKEAVTQLLRQLDDAEKTSKNQTVQDLRDKLNDKRNALGDEKFKAILEQLKRDAVTDFLALLKRLFPELFADDRLRLQHRVPHRRQIAVAEAVMAVGLIQAILAAVSP